jgi:hypothetical protein
MKNGYKALENIDYDSYIKHQMSHKNTKNRTARRNYSLYIEKIKDLFPDAKKILCVGSRDEHEVKSLRKSGFEAIGIDLFSNDQSIIKILDMHEIEDNFLENEFDIIFSCHSLEHCCDPERVLRGFHKVSKIGAFIVLPFGKTSVDFTHPVNFDFMSLDNRKTKIENQKDTKVDVENDFNQILRNKKCSVIDFQFKPVPVSDGYWISVKWDD